jgi:zinc finger protein
MCTICDTCGVKSSEVKPGTAIEEKGIKFELKVTDVSDLNRDLIKSEYATFEIPEIEFYMNSGTLGGKFTTLEGLLKDSREQLDEISPFSAGGDSEAKGKASRMKECLDKLESIQNGQMLNVTIILDDPSGNSYLQVRLICKKVVFETCFDNFFFRLLERLCSR